MKDDRKYMKKCTENILKTYENIWKYDKKNDRKTYENIWKYVKKDNGKHMKMHRENIQKTYAAAVITKAES